MASSKQQKKDTTGNDEGKKYNCQCGDSFSSVENSTSTTTKRIN